MQFNLISHKNTKIMIYLLQTLWIYYFSNCYKYIYLFDRTNIYEFHLSIINIIYNFFMSTISYHKNCISHPILKIVMINVMKIGKFIDPRYDPKFDLLILCLLLNIKILDGQLSSLQDYQPFLFYMFFLNDSTFFLTNGFLNKTFFYNYTTNYYFIQWYNSTQWYNSIYIYIILG